MSAIGEVYRIKKTDFFNKMKSSDMSWRMLKDICEIREGEIEKRVKTMVHVHSKIHSKQRSLLL
jgi:hypothetical protein